MYDPPLFPGEEQAWNGNHSEIADLVMRLCDNKYAYIHDSWYQSRHVLTSEGEVLEWFHTDQNEVYSDCLNTLRDHLEKRRIQIGWQLGANPINRVQLDAQYGGIMRLLWMTVVVSSWYSIMKEVQILLHSTPPQCEKCQTYCSRYIGYTHFCGKCRDATIRQHKILFDPVHREMLFSYELPNWYHNEARKAEEHFNSLANVQTGS